MNQIHNHELVFAGKQANFGKKANNLKQFDNFQS